ncbi:MAG: DNA helicase UvrD [Candidatus Aenigmarchaeota archaeon]|nr:DNA helicase UvrD [Candidatus Aenigmarchaeota archaeon]
MQVICDFQIHSKYSRATSPQMDLEAISKGAALKGLNLMGTGDATHPEWFKILKQKLGPPENRGVYLYNGIFWIITAEVSTIYEQDGKIRKVHHLFHVPDFETMGQINEKLEKYGGLSSDGRPILNGLPSPELVEILMGISKDIFVYPAHYWTPFFGCGGSKTGFDSIKECYKDQTKNIFAIETGLSSDPSMNWRLSKLDRFALLSSSDAHSANPWRLGREANVFDLERPTYEEIHNAIKSKNKEKFLYTIETSPEYGKYHFDGHRDCNVAFEPEETKKISGICPRCKRRLTIGVLSRVEQLADRPAGFIPENAIPFKTLLSLYEIISHVTGVNALYSKKVTEEHDKIISRFGTELNVLMNVDEADLKKITHEKIASAIIRSRSGLLKFKPGYDGVYGVPLFDGDREVQKSGQKGLDEFVK